MFQAPEYFVKSRHGGQKRSAAAAAAASSRGRQSAAAWEQRFPLHAAAYRNDAALVRCVTFGRRARRRKHTRALRTLLERGHDVNEADAESWSALHYAAFYNCHDACATLMLRSDVRVNAPNDNASSPLHFAAINGHALLLELMLSHAAVDTASDATYARLQPQPHWWCGRSAREMPVARLQGRVVAQNLLRCQC